MEKQKENLTDSTAMELSPVLNEIVFGGAVCKCTEEPCWGVGGKCVTCGLSVKQPPDWDVDDRLDELEMTPEEIESDRKCVDYIFKHKLKPNCDFPE